MKNRCILHGQVFVIINVPLGALRNAVLFNCGIPWTFHITVFQYFTVNGHSVVNFRHTDNRLSCFVHLIKNIFFPS